ncbi:hypothetical protein J5N97_001755, partial [Dioscorea zingiberensis]
FNKDLQEQKLKSAFGTNPKPPPSEVPLIRVYKAEFSNGKVFAVKKIDSAALYLCRRKIIFLRLFSNMSDLGTQISQHLQEFTVLNMDKRFLVYEYLHEVSTQMVGSFGYSAPEFAMSGVYTVKSDVYSFGVVMLELLTGRKPLDSSRERSEQSLVRWATPQLHDIDSLSKMVDPALNGIYPAKSLSRFADIIALCVQQEAEFKPSMSEVVQSLVRLMQQASVIDRRSSNDELGFPSKISEYEAATDISF